MSSPFYRVRWLLRARKSFHLHPWQNGILYALLCDAARGDGTEADQRIPDGLLLEAPEVGRTVVEPGEEFAFGATLIDDDLRQASRRLHRISRGLSRMGQVTPAKPVAIGGNFDLVEVHDLVAQKSLSEGEHFEPISADHVSMECQQLLPFLGQPLTLRFLSPVRIELPGSEVRESRRYASDWHINVDQLLHMVQKRLQAVGLIARETEIPQNTQVPIELIENRLVWLDLAHGGAERRKTLGGALGRVRVKVNEIVPLAALVWGQYARVGKNLHFGFGRYRIEELGTDPFLCSRAKNLLEQVCTPQRVQVAAREYELDSETLQNAAQALQEGRHIPATPNLVTLRKADGSKRILQVPARQDRALQRLILNRLAPAFDRLFESSSFAWRSGLSREGAARRIERLAAEGWNYAVKADIDRFFETIPQSKLRDRLEVWCGDDRLAEAILRFIPPGLGIPTGAPLSPLLGNLFLDQFDEQIEREGGKLVRYADDFLILTRTREEAEKQHQTVQELAADLELKLNADSAVLDIREGFEFLGYQFHREERWQYAGPSGPKKVRELGWKDSDRIPALDSLPLPGELDEVAVSGVVVAGPGIEHLDVVGDTIAIQTALEERSIPIAGLDRMVIFGPAAWTADAPGKLLKAGVPVLLVSANGWPQGELAPLPSEDAESLQAQVLASIHPERSLAIARELVRVKLRNFASLLLAASPHQTAPVRQLQDFALQATVATDKGVLLGIEGAGASLWYRCFPKLLANGFRFPRRISPDADDPVNVMLNLGHTMMYRHGVTACRAAGLSPAIGFLHASTARFAALAADLQEPFRHVIERAVILATRRIKPAHFISKENASYPLVMEPHAAKTFHVLLQRSLRRSVVACGQTETRSWLAQMVSTARSLRRHLIDPHSPWQPFEHI